MITALASSYWSSEGPLFVIALSIGKPESLSSAADVSCQHHPSPARDCVFLYDIARNTSAVQSIKLTKRRRYEQNVPYQPHITNRCLLRSLPHDKKRRKNKFTSARRHR